MSQHDMNIANQGFPSFRSDLNNALAALVSNSSGATEPTTKFAHQLWVDTAANPSVLKIRNADNDAWITIGSIDQTGDTFTLVNLRTSGPVVFNDAGADVDFRVESDTNANMLFVDASTDRVGIGTNTPAATLDVNGVLDANGIIIGTNGDSIQTSGGNFFFQTTSAHDLIFRTNSTERMRITSGGYLKASNAGSYANSGAAYHELVQSSSNIDLYAFASNASYASIIYYANCARAATSAYSFAGWASNGGTDLEFDFVGNGNAYADGTFNNNGADYAEFFESANGEALTLGATVVLDGNKVREATDQDPASAIIGVVRPKEPSKASMVVGNTAWNKWANKYLTDDFDRYIMEDHDVVEWEETITDEEGNTSTKQHSYESHNIPTGITVPADATRKTHDDKGNKFQHYKLNPEWNPDSEYVNRENRPEWNIIGLLGQVKILKGQPVGDRWVKMRDISETVEEWFIR